MHIEENKNRQAHRHGPGAEAAIAHCIAGLADTAAGIVVAKYALAL